MPLVIIESPNKISKLKKILGSNFDVVATVGHFMKLSKKKLGFDHSTFSPNYEVDPKKKEVVRNIKSHIKKHKEIYIATDPDREGEAIGMHIENLIPKRGKKIYRVKFNAITKEAVKKAMKSPGSIDKNLCLSQTARRVTDRIVGYKISPVMWKKGMANTSAGRVQSVALKIISEREKAVKAFNPEEYWSIDCKFENGLVANLKKINGKKPSIKNKSEASSIEALIKKAAKSSVKVTQYKAKTTYTSPKPPFTTSTLQQDASNKLSWPSKKTMNVAQSIFSSGLITYHRTDSTRVEDSKILDVRKSIESKYGKNYLSKSKNLYSNKDASQDAHEAIRPTYEPVPAAFSSDEKKLLSLITKRFEASQMAKAEHDRVGLVVTISSKENKYEFSASGSTLKFDGFLKVYGSKSDDVLLPKLKLNQDLKTKSFVKNQHFTKAPPRYTDASLIKLLEKEGVGRPSTYSSIIETLVDRKYVVRNKKTLSSTETGIMISDYLSDKFKEITSAEFTSKMEKTLDEISQGSKPYLPVMKSFWESIVSSIDEAMQSGLPKSFSTEHRCDLCSSHMIKKISKHGPFLACSAWPSCSGTKSIDGKSKIVELETGDPCPSCGNILVKRSGKNGSFWGCKSFPVCKFTKAEEDEFQEKVSCDKCKEGFMVKRKGRYGFFWGCNMYPKCKNIKKKI